jgi:hypothetical protein
MIIFTDMKKYLWLVLALLPLVSCEQKISETVDYNITLDKSNTYYAGEPVKFNIDGQVDNVLFYSGETGAQYVYKDRYSVPIDQVNSALLTLKLQARYGLAGGLDIYISDSFAGLKGNDAAADKATITQMVSGGMADWEKLDYQDGTASTWTSQSIDLTKYLGNFCIAFHWHPIRDGKSAQRTYWINGGLTLDMQGTNPSSVDLSSLNFTSIMMNDEIANPYVINNGNGSIIFNKPTTAAIIFQGTSATALTYALDGWVISTPSALNKVPNDQGNVIKNLQNYMGNYEYTYSKPGTYTATFVGINSNYKGSSKDVKEVKITIVDKP